MKDRISIVVPVYNTYQYLPTCLKSIQEQSYDDFECILVDDGSPDLSSAYCDELVLQDSRFLVMHKQNGHISSARNAGICLASGNYITFIDSDDALNKEALEFMHKGSTSLNADIICMNHVSSNLVFSGFPKQKKFSIDESCVMDNRKLFVGICMRTQSQAVWCKLFRKALFSDLRFDVGILNEDFLLLAKMLSTDLRIAKIEYAGYYHFLHSGSISSPGFKKNMIDSVYNAHFAWENSIDAECKEAALSYLLHRFLMFFINMPYSYIQKKNEHWISVFSSLSRNKKGIAKSYLSCRDRMILRLCLISPSFTKRVVDLIRKMLSNFK